MSEKKDTGTMTAAELQVMRKTVAEQFKIEVGRMVGPKPGLSKKQAADLIAGHDDGMRNIVIALRLKGILVISD